MITPGNLPLSGGRFVPFTYEIEVQGLDLNGAALLAQVRLYKNAPGDPLINLVQVGTASAEGVRLIGVATVDGLPASTIGIRVNESTMEAMQSSGDPMRPDAPFAWDLHVTPSGGLKYVLLEGSFIVRGGVTNG